LDKLAQRSKVRKLPKHMSRVNVADRWRERVRVLIGEVLYLTAKTCSDVRMRYEKSAER